MSLLAPCPLAKAMLKEQVSAPSWDQQVLFPGTGKLGARGSLGQGEAVFREQVSGPQWLRLRSSGSCPAWDLVVELSLIPAPFQ